ncbi:polysaccharide pyruvyl transferase family protein [Gaoshiqia sediminis]|uniref:Polysaccharide pyruvyl transferase family protein n=1 Tax=Gaoshiqia sediminis TaxID=2986998 RepID=A0AA41YCV1_9BACT|nr:polysaccharide pyruvyl transferase family protein [Gaoshiqia sediminis]MCW0484120.1 polysaccharide pyruvyl transferase family protein [Gaoshiqia sediminis]
MVQKKAIGMLNFLKDKIMVEVTPLIKNDYIFLDLPYYTNIGDTLIWKGTEEFLKTLPYKCRYRAAIETYRKPTISRDVIILLQGGGNFGDIWRRHTDFCLRIIHEFPENRIIVLPQTVYYADITVLKADAERMAKHPNLTICARDLVTHELLKTNFSNNNILLLPDMAFCIPQSYLNKYIQPVEDKTLFFKRKDKEFQSFDFRKHLRNHSNVEEHEWPSMEKRLIGNNILNYLKSAHGIFSRFKFLGAITAKVVDWYAIHIYMPYLVKIGIQFLSSYQYIFTTRLHGAILAVLLQKTITFFDNSYGKNSSFYNTWLKDAKEIEFVEREL